MLAKCLNDYDYYSSEIVLVGLASTAVVHRDKLKLLKLTHMQNSLAVPSFAVVVVD